MIDYHTHTKLCKHAIGTPEEYIIAAENAGLDEIGISDHTPWPTGYDADFRMLPEKFREYRELVAMLAKRNAKIKVKYALEIDWVPGRMDEVWSHVDSEPFDYLIGSVHYTDELPFDNPDHKAVWENVERSTAVWNRYYELLLEFVSVGGFEIIGHLDLPKKFGSIPPETDKMDALTNDIMTAAADNNIVLELNTAGLRKPVGEIYPSKKLLQKANAKDVQITFGSDAHRPQDVAANFAEAITLAKECGYDTYTTFEARTPLPQRL